MQRQELVRQLAQLQEQLARTQRVDPESLELLRRLTAEVEQMPDEVGTPVADDEPVTSRLRSLLLKFEAEHPQLSAALGKVADALAAIGI